MNGDTAGMAVYTISHVGQRDENQDRFAVLEPTDGDSWLFVVADGLGGHSDGALAAQLVVDTAARMWPPRLADPARFLHGLVLECHAAVRQLGQQRDLDTRSTLAALLMRRTEVTSIHVGDSRVMQYSDISLVAQTSDHSFAQLLVSRGQLSEREAAGHPAQARLLSSIGGARTPTAKVNRWDLAGGTRFVVCSDGFWGAFDHAEILTLFDSGDPELVIRQRLKSKLERAQHHDNCTAILIKLTR